MDKLENVLAKAFTSSNDPTKISTTVKGVLTGMAPIAMYVMGLNPDDYETLSTSIVSIVFMVTSVVGAIMTAWGVVRKIKLGRWNHPDA